MTKKVKDFDFYVNYMDIDEYLRILADRYGKNTSLVKVIDDSGLIEQSDNPQKYKKNADKILNEIRSLLVKNGFEKEIDVCDEEFSKTRKNRGMKNPYTSLSKRMR